jgi:hypothetical protein
VGRGLGNLFGSIIEGKYGAIYPTKHLQTFYSKKSTPIAATRLTAPEGPENEDEND